MRGAYQSLKRVTFGMPLTIATGIVLGGLLSPVAIATNDWLAAQYDRVFPVVEMNGQLLSLGDDEAVIALAGRKNRECTYTGIQAYSVGRDGNMTDTFIVRTDIPESRDTKPRGTFDVGTWRVWPLPDSRGIVVYINHLCGSRVVLTKVAHIPLAEPKKGLL